MKRIQKHTEEAGDLYVTLIIPSFALSSFHHQRCNGWYLAHTNPEQLEEPVLRRYYETFGRLSIIPEGDRMQRFFTWLCGLRLGYVLITTGASSYTVIDVGKEDEHGR